MQTVLTAYAAGSVKGTAAGGQAGRPSWSLSFPYRHRGESQGLLDSTVTEQISMSLHHCKGSTGEGTSPATWEPGYHGSHILLSR